MNEREMIARTKQFALRIMKLVGALPKSIQGRAIGNQLMRSGTSVAANYRAACRARSKLEFIAKLGTVEEEADETAAAASKKTASSTLAKSQIASRKSQIP